MSDSEGVIEAYQKYLDTRVRLRCTNKECSSSSGFWTAEIFVDDYLNKLSCILCDSKIAHELKEVKND